VDLLLIVSDPTIKGLQTIKRIDSLVDELKLDVKQRAFVVNRVLNQHRDDLPKYAAKVGLTDFHIVPQDERIAEYDLKGEPVMELPEDSVSLKAVFALLDAYKIP